MFILHTLYTVKLNQTWNVDVIPCINFGSVVKAYVFILLSTYGKIKLRSILFYLKACADSAKKYGGFKRRESSRTYPYLVLNINWAVVTLWHISHGTKQEISRPCSNVCTRSPHILLSAHPNNIWRTVQFTNFLISLFLIYSRHFTSLTLISPYDFIFRPQ